MTSLAHVMGPAARRRRHAERGRPEGSPDLETPIAAAEYVVFDTELTGLKSRKNSIVSIGAVRMRGIEDPGRRALQPDRAAQDRTHGQSIVIHGITPSETRTCPGIESALPEFLEFCRGDVLVGHVVSMDLQFVNDEMRRCYGTPIANPAVDTLALAAFLQKARGRQKRLPRGGRAPAGPLLAGDGVRHPGAAGRTTRSTTPTSPRNCSSATSPILPKHGVRTVGELIKIGKP